MVLLFLLSRFLTSLGLNSTFYIKDTLDLYMSCANDFEDLTITFNYEHKNTCPKWSYSV